MKRGRNVTAAVCIIALCSTLVLGAGCATQGQTGALTGAGVGALAGGLANMHGSWGATALVGAGVGAGIGYLIGNEEDKKEAARRQALREDETRPLAHTTWQVISVVPPSRDHYKSLVSHFRPDGYVVTTRTYDDGRVETDTERYRIVGSTLIINKPDYVINARFRFDRDRMMLDTGRHSIVMQRVGG
ncbi:MAG: glycine zipper domain-containing protein [Nitrospirae bacterium]|nr:glycine zipper domain-containing protein [Nitrospirota bacterium]